MAASYPALSLEHFNAARASIAEHIQPTPLVQSPHFSALFGCRVWLKPENLQRTGAYKIRGACYRVSVISDEEAQRGLITASAGNHAQGLALAGQLRGVPVRIVMPEATPLVKVNNTKAYGAEVILEGAGFDDALERAREMAEAEGLVFVHPFDDLDVACGQGTMAFEILEDLPDADVILVPVGGGGLATGVATLAKLLRPEVRVIGVEPSGAASLAASLRAGHTVTLPQLDTIADGVAVKHPGDQLFPYLVRGLDGVVTVPDDQLIGVFLDMLEQHKMLVENAGLLPVAALRQLDFSPETRVVCVLSGGNMDVITLSSLVQHGLIARNRIFTFSVLLPDKPGELERVAHVVAEAKGNIIGLEHNQFVSINRYAAVELKVTLEAFGPEHKSDIMNALRLAGFEAYVTHSTSIY